MGMSPSGRWISLCREHGEYIKYLAGIAAFSKLELTVVDAHKGGLFHQGRQASIQEHKSG